MPYIKKTVYAGRTIEIEKYYSARYGQSNGTRKRNRKETTAQQAERNRQKSITELRRKINANFGFGDLHVTFTYKPELRPQSKEEAVVIYRAFLRRLKRAYKKAGIEFKYIAVTEYESKSIHHHFILPKIDTTFLLLAWGLGGVHFSTLDNSGNYGRLAEYLIKETDRTFKTENGYFGKRYNCSSNLKKPRVHVEEISAKRFSTEPKAYKGYYIDKESVVVDMDDWSMPMLRYIMINYSY